MKISILTVGSLLLLGVSMSSFGSDQIPQVQLEMQKVYKNCQLTRNQLYADYNKKFTSRNGMIGQENQIAKRMMTNKVEELHDTAYEEFFSKNKGFNKFLCKLITVNEVSYGIGKPVYRTSFDCGGGLKFGNPGYRDWANPKNNGKYDIREDSPLLEPLSMLGYNQPALISGNFIIYEKPTKKQLVDRHNPFLSGDVQVQFTEIIPLDKK